MTSAVPNSVHLVGSIGLDSVPEVFRTLGKTLGRRLKRVPDGEVGGRRLWTSWQYPLFRANPFLAATEVHRPRTGWLEMKVADGVAPDEIVFGELGYSREARASYLDFVEAKQRGELPESVRFQVCLPTPFAVVGTCCRPADAGAIQRSYTKAMLTEVETVCAKIPHKDLAIQWDICMEMIFWDGQDYPGRTTRKDITREGIVADITELCRSVPSDVELGIHLCYGDFEAKHFIEPIDAAKMVEFANALAGAITHPLAFIHLPVPINRTDDAFFKPFADLKVAKNTEVYLGVVHAADGASGTNRRISAASTYLKGFGIACECGIARARRPDLIKSILAIHSQASVEPN